MYCTSCVFSWFDTCSHIIILQRRMFGVWLRWLTAASNIASNLYYRTQMDGILREIDKELGTMGAGPYFQGYFSNFELTSLLHCEPLRGDFEQQYRYSLLLRRGLVAGGHHVYTLPRAHGSVIALLQGVSSTYSAVPASVALVSRYGHQTSILGHQI